MGRLQCTLTGHVTPADKARSDYVYVPFDLPAPATALRVRYRYSDPISAAQTSGGNVFDIGLFDPRGAEFPGGAGFRGWSGSARSEFTITPDDATPGYLPGPLPAGRYQILLGLYRVQPAGGDYTIGIEAELDDAPQATGDRSPTTDHEPADQSRASARRDDSTAASSMWLRGDFQSHTVHSDAKGTIAQITAKARALRLDFLAITDHNTTSHHTHLPACADDDLLLIPGQESTTYYGHMNIWGTRRWCDFRCRTADEIAQVIALAHAHGGICSINHPKRDGPPWEYGDDLPTDTLEVWQGPWANRNTESLARWERLLNLGRRVPVVGGSDYHCPAAEEVGFLRLGQPTTWVRAAERSVPAILDAIVAGRATISCMPDGPRLDLRARCGDRSAAMGDTLLVTGESPITVEVEIERGAGWALRIVADGQVAYDQPVGNDSGVVRCDVTATRYVRAELVGDTPPEILPPNAPAGIDLRDWRWALSNPIYIAADEPRGD